VPAALAHLLKKNLGYEIYFSLRIAAMLIFAVSCHKKIHPHRLNRS